MLYGRWIYGRQKNRQKVSETVMTFPARKTPKLSDAIFRFPLSDYQARPAETGLSPSYYVKANQTVWKRRPALAVLEQY